MFPGTGLYSKLFAHCGRTYNCSIIIFNDNHTFDEVLQLCKDAGV